MNSLSYFKGSAIFTVLAIGAAYLIAGPKGALIAAILSILEVSLSFDNAVVNATVLKNMDAVWKKRFLTWGMLIAVFGMRVIFPLLIVSIAVGISPYGALMLAINTPEQYATTLTAAHVGIAGFGGAFLFMVFLKFFLDAEKDVHWVQVIEQPLIKLGKVQSMEIILTLFAMFIISKFLQPGEVVTFLVSGIFGIIAYVLVDGLGDLLAGDEEETSGVSAPAVVAKSGLAGFLYLEMLDSSFSFDGVIGAFALSNNIFIIALGLGVGAMFVRSLTILMVDKGTLDEFRYLEHGAFYGIAALASIMFIGLLTHIPEVITGLIGAGFIILAVISSVMHNRKIAEVEILIEKIRAAAKH